MLATKAITAKLRRIKLLLLDVDGVLTDGSIYYSATGAEMKRFSALDGYGAARAREHGLKLGIISGRQTPIVDVRAKELGIEDVAQNASDKVAAMNAMRQHHGLDIREIAFMGDDLFDLPLLSVVGLSAAPKNAVAEVKKTVDYVTGASGGGGAVREVIDLIIRYQRNSGQR
jgi:3-deoxy-D-manno-octulosonate 8-phosphate phosphatase (KDO 8-P phosphatase)